jgi:hypothetical protein
MNDQDSFHRLAAVPDPLDASPPISCSENTLAGSRMSLVFREVL